MNFRYIVIASSLFLLLSSCKKKIVEIVPVMEVESDLSIAGADAIKYFSFPGSSVGYAASEADFIYKTTNSGNSWTSILVTNNKICSGLEFFDADKGMCLMDDDLYVTADGGQSWSLMGSGDFIGITDDGVGVVGDCGQTSCAIRTSTDFGQTFLLQGTIDYSISFDFLAARIVDSKVVLFPKQGWDFPDENMFDLVTNNSSMISFGSINNFQTPNDVYLLDGNGTVVGKDGLIIDDNLGSSWQYSGHSYSYYSIDGDESFAVCVGEKTITTNLDIGNEENWNEVFDVEGNGFTETFYRIRFIDEKTFYISGSNGLLLKARI